MHFAAGREVRGLLRLVVRTVVAVAVVTSATVVAVVTSAPVVAVVAVAVVAIVASAPVVAVVASAVVVAVVMACAARFMAEVLASAGMVELFAALLHAVGIVVEVRREFPRAAADGVLGFRLLDLRLDLGFRLLDLRLDLRFRLLDLRLGLRLGFRLLGLLLDLRLCLRLFRFVRLFRRRFRRSLFGLRLGGSLRDRFEVEFFDQAVHRLLGEVGGSGLAGESERVERGDHIFVLKAVLCGPVSDSDIF